MSSETEQSPLGQSLSPALAAQSPAGAFCPVNGWFRDTSWKFNEDMRCLLGKRLQIAAMIMTGGFAAFFLRNLLLPEMLESLGTAFMAVHAGVTLAVGGLLAVLWVRPCLSLRQLRGFELALFGIPAAFFAWMQYHIAGSAGGNELRELAATFPFRSVLPWLSLIYVYGICIPNAWQRTALFAGAMAVLPFVGAFAAGLHHPEIAGALRESGYSSMALWMGIGAATAVYGSHRLVLLRREVFDSKSVGVYTLKEKLGSGGMGDVYLAEHHLLKRKCAIKLIKPEKAENPQALARFESEVQAAASLTHQNTIEIYDYGRTDDGTFYYAMEFLPGMNLQEMVDRYGPLPPERVVYLLRQVCSALREAHAVGLIHRDIKPGNIFAADRGGVYDVTKLLDFGLVKTVQADGESIKQTIDGTVVGSPLFTAPELALGGTPDARSDVYSLGTTAYFLLTGHPVFSGENAIKVIFAHANEAPLDIRSVAAGIPAELAEIVMRCLEKQPENRFHDVGELQRALERCELPAVWTADDAARWWSELQSSGSLQEPAFAETMAMTTFANAETG